MEALIITVDMITLLTCLASGFFFGVYLLYKVFSLLENRYSHHLSKHDYVVGAITIYADFGFVLLMMLFTMLAMIKSFSI